MVGVTRHGDRPKTIAVIGGGASGTLVATHLLYRWDGDLRVHLIERRRDLGQGVAYSTRSMRHLLNVPAGKMSALPDDPDHFLRWLRTGPMPEAAPETFAPRPLFHAYLLFALGEAERLCPQASLERVRGEVVSVKAREPGATVGLRDGRGLRADRVVLALGNLPPRNPGILDGSFYADPRYVPDAWAPGALDGVADEDPILLVGTSLTAIDVAISLKEAGHRATIHAVSRRGLVPNPHKRGDPEPPDPAVGSAPGPHTPPLPPRPAPAGHPGGIA